MLEHTVKCHLMQKKSNAGMGLLRLVASFDHASDTLGSIDWHIMATLVMGKLLHYGECSIEGRPCKT